MQDTLGRLAASLATTETSLAEARAEMRHLDEALAAAERAAVAAAEVIQARLSIVAWGHHVFDSYVITGSALPGCHACAKSQAAPRLHWALRRGW